MTPLSRDRDRVVPLGVAFTDGPGGPPVPDGLTVWAWPEGNEARQVAGVVNAAGVAWFGLLPGLTVDPADPFAGPGKPFLVEVRDTRGRFVPGRVGVTAPARGAVVVALRSAPGRQVPPGRVAFLVELWDSPRDRPAAFARLTVRMPRNGNGGPPETPDQAAKRVLAEGLADATGWVLVAGDMPPPKSAGVAAGPTRWDAPRPVEVEVRYAPVPGGRPDPPRLDGLADQPLARVRKSPDAPFDSPGLSAAGLTELPPAEPGRVVHRLLITPPDPA